MSIIANVNAKIANFNTQIEITSKKILNTKANFTNGTIEPSEEVDELYNVLARLKRMKYKTIAMLIDEHEPR